MDWTSVPMKVSVRRAARALGPPCSFVLLTGTKETQHTEVGVGPSSLMTLGLNTLDLVRPHGLPPDHNFPCMGNTRDPR